MSSSEMRPLRIDVWSDVACPWCYVGKRRLEAALERFPERGSVRVRWRAFELDPAIPAVEDASVPYAERLARKYRTSLAQAERMIRAMTETAAAEGLDFRFDRIRPGNTFDAHRLLHLAAEHGLQDAAKERLLRAYMTEGEAIGKREVLARLAGEVGIAPDQARAMLAGDRFSSQVRADEEEAATRGILAVPHFSLGERHGARGAQPPEVLLEALRSAWQEYSGAGAPAGPACGPEGCV